MKVIAVDNFDRENVSDVLIFEGLSPVDAKKMADNLNEKFGGDSAPRFYKAVPDRAPLYEFKP